MLIQRRGTGPEHRLNDARDEDDKPDFFFNYFSLGMVGFLAQIFYLKICGMENGYENKAFVGNIMMNALKK